MSVYQVRVHPGAYLDSLVLMLATVSMEESPGVSWAGAFMATPKVCRDLTAAGFQADNLTGLDANDLVLAAQADNDAAVRAALDVGWDVAFAEGDDGAAAAVDLPPASIADAVRRAPDLNVAIVSVPGEYAALEAHHALTAGLHVLLFSDGVSLEEEIELKERAAYLGRLVMGPGAGTAVLAGTGLGFANVAASAATSVGAVGVVAAAGTGAQEVASLLDRWGVAVTHVIGVGGRDLTEQVGGRMAALAVGALDADAGTSAILLVSKPPSSAVGAAVLARCRSTPAVAVFLGTTDLEPTRGARLARTLEQGARAVAELVGVLPPVPWLGLADSVAGACHGLTSGRTLIRGLFSGGTLCYEAQLILEAVLGPVYSNEPLRHQHGLPAPDGAHVLLDLGAEEYTRGVPHPMIDPRGRIELLRRQRDDPAVGVVLLDVVLGHGAHADPAGQLAPVCAEVMAHGGPQVVAYVLGTEADPQVYSQQRKILEAAGCIVPETNARAALAAAALVLRRPELTESEP